MVHCAFILSAIASTDGYMLHDSQRCMDFIYDTELYIIESRRVFNKKLIIVDTINIHLCIESE